MDEPAASYVPVRMDEPLTQIEDLMRQQKRDDGCKSAHEPMKCIRPVLLLLPLRTKLQPHDAFWQRNDGAQSPIARISVVMHVT